MSAISDFEEKCARYSWKLPYEGFDPSDPDRSECVYKGVVYDRGGSKPLKSYHSNVTLDQIVRDLGPGSYTLRYVNARGPAIYFEYDEEQALHAGWKDPSVVQLEDIESKPKDNPSVTMAQGQHLPIVNSESLISLLFTQIQTLTSALMNSNNNKQSPAFDIATIMHGGQKIGLDANQAALERAYRENELLRQDKNKREVELNDKIKELEDSLSEANDRIHDLELDIAQGAQLEPKQDTMDKLVGLGKEFLPLFTNQQAPINTLNPSQNLGANLTPEEIIKRAILQGFQNNADMQRVKDIISSALNQSMFLKQAFTNFDVNQICDYVYKMLGQENDQLKIYLFNVIKLLKGL